MISSRSRSLYNRRGEHINIVPVRRAGSLVYQSQREESIQKFSKMQNTSPEDMTPVPDYEDNENNDNYDKYFSFATSFGSVINNIKLIEEQYDIPEPEPDYNDNDEIDSEQLGHGEPVLIRPRQPSESEKRLSDPDVENNELIKPRKLSNPCVESKERMALHKELLQNYKIGKNVLEKSELTKVFEQKKEKQRKQEWDDKKKAEQKRSSLECRLELQASKLKEQEEETMKPIKEETNQSELSKIQARILKNGQVN